MTLAVGLLLTLVAGTAFAQTAVPTVSTANFSVCTPHAGGVLDSLSSQFGGYTSSWMSTAQNYARHIFVGLAGLEFAWWGIQMVLKRRDLEDLLASMFLKFLSLMFFYLVMIQFAPEWIPKIIASFVQMGQNIGGEPSIPTLAGSNPLGTMLSPSSVMGMGMCLAGEVMQLPAPSGLLKAVIYGFSTDLTSLVIIIAYAIVALTLLLAIIEAYIVTGAGLVMLGFLGSRWTSSWGEKYFGYAVSMGVKLMVTYLVVGLGQTIISSYVMSTGALVIANALGYSGGASGASFAGLCMAALIFAGLAWNVPKLASSFLNGQPGMGMGDMVAPAAMAGAAVAGAASLATGGAAAAVAGLKQLTSLTSGAMGGGGGANGASAATDGMAALASLASRTSGAGTGSGMSAAPSAASGSSAASARAPQSARSASKTAGATPAGGAKPTPASSGESAASSPAASSSPSQAAQPAAAPGTADSPAEAPAPAAPNTPGVQANGTEKAIGGAPAAPDTPNTAPGQDDKRDRFKGLKQAAQTGADLTRNVTNRIEGHDGSVAGISIRFNHIED